MHAYLDEVRANVVLSHGHFTACGDRSTRIQGEVDDLHWVARLLAGAGLPYSIESPPELAEAVRAYAFEMVANVERDGVAQQPIEDAGLPDVRSTRL